MKRIVVFHVISELNIGGAEKHLALLAPYLHHHHEVVVVCLSRAGAVSQLLTQRGITVIHLGLHPFDPRILVRLHALVRLRKPQKIVAYLLAADFWCRLAGVGGRIPVISAQRSSFYKRGYLRWVDLATTRLVTRYVVQTKAMQNRLSTLFHRPRTDFAVIPNAVELPEKKTAVPALPKAELTVTCVSNLRPGKGHDILLAAWKKISTQFPQAQLLLIGAGPLRKPLSEFVQTHALQSSVHFLGTSNNVDALLAATDIFVLPTRAEGMSNALLQAMAAGVPCLASDITANQAVIEAGKTGEFFRDGSSDSLADTLQVLLTSADRRSQLGQAAADHVATAHNPEHIATLWQEVLVA